MLGGQAQEEGDLLDENIIVERLGPSRASDLAHALAVLVQAAESALAVSSPASKNHLAQALGMPNCYVFLATDADGPVGYASAYRFPRLDAVGDQVYLFDIEVASFARQRGVGRSLLEGLLATCWAEGVQWAWAGTARENIPAQRLFAAAGGLPAGETYIEYHFTPDK